VRLPVPSPLVAVEAAGTPRRGAGRVVLARPGEPPVLGPGGADLALTGQVSGQAGATHRQDGHWVLGVGEGAPADWRTAGASLARALQAETERDGGTAFDVLLTPGSDVRSFVLGLVLGGYRFRVTGEPAPPRLKAVRLVGDAAADEVREAVDLAAATALTRDLANAPANLKDPAWLASTAARLARTAPGLEVAVRDERWLAAEGFGGVLAVGGGSARPPRLVQLTWNGAATGPHLVLVGKGITFDTGGISIKPAEGMHLMRTDMAGGAAVIAALVAVARRGLPVRVTGLVPCAENHVSGTAYRPGDVVRHYGGTTTEVTNTDAEGRLVLADAMAYAVRALDADALVDVATLTGAMKVSLGVRTGGLFASDDALAAAVVAAGERTGETWWRMPLPEYLAEEVASDVADLRQCPPGPGGITAALFLREFAGGLPWAHLDIAGPARSDKNYAEVVPGASGFAARTLVSLVEHYGS